MPTPVVRKMAPTVAKPEPKEMKKEPEPYRALLKDAGAFVLVFDFHPTLGPLMNFGPLMRFAHEGQGILKRMFGEPEMTKPAEKVEPKPVTMRRVVAKRAARRAPIRKAA